jgi:hypothetical protein
MLFNFMTNMEPNAQTYLTEREVFSFSHIRGQGAVVTWSSALKPTGDLEGELIRQVTSGL